MICSTRPDPPDHCPTLDEVHGALLAALPHGRAWPRTPGSVLTRFWRGVAIVHHWINDRLCAWEQEFHCDTATESLDDWWIEYGLPDGCDPWPDLCAKVTGVLGGTCADFAEIAARAGWAIGCIDDATVGAGCFVAGCSPAGSAVDRATLVVAVDLAASPAFTGTTAVPASAGASSDWGAGQALGCGPDILPLICLLSRIVPAHVAIEYHIGTAVLR